jgi:hypothetical protein
MDYKTTVRWTPHAEKRIKAAARNKRQTVSQWIREAVSDALRRGEGPMRCSKCQKVFCDAHAHAGHKCAPTWSDRPLVSASDSLIV